MSRYLSLKRPSTLVAAALWAASLAGPAFAADPTIDQIHAKAVSGDIQGSLTMMEPVLKDHPNSAKAHYVEAELLAHAHRIGEARIELAKAQELAPGLPGVKPQSLSQLNAALNGTAGRVAGTGVAAPVPVQSSLPWGPIVVIGLAVFALLAILRRRSAPAYVQANGAAGYPAGMTGAPGPGYAPGYGGGMPMGGGMGAGMGGGILGGLASGVAMGAGVAVGEEVIGHMFGGHQSGIGGMGGGIADPNADMGGNDFGISDAGSWDDGGSGGGDGGW